MNRNIDLTKLGGLFTYQDTLEFMQLAYSQPLDALAKFTGEKFVVSGCVDDGANVSEGWIVVNGELLPFTGGAINTQIVIETILADEGFDDGTLKQVYTTKRASFGIAGGFNYTDLKRLPFSSTSISECVTQIASMVKNIIQFEPEVILEGCNVSAVNTGASTLEISTGMVLFAGKIVRPAAYAGTYPVYLKEDGGWVTAVPGAGLYITFDPYTSQRYKNVLDRAVTPEDRVIMATTLTDRFDGAGVGRWEMKGYSLMASMQGRVPVGLWFDGVPEANVTDAIYQVDGNQGGERLHTLQSGEQGAITMNAKMDDIGGGTASAVARIRLNGVENPINGAANQGSYGTDTNVPAAAASTGHNNVQPFTVIVYAKRTA